MGNKIVITKCIECSNWIPADSHGSGVYCDELKKVISALDTEFDIPDECPKLAENCPLCGSNYIKVIYYGLPHKLCENEDCNCLFGFWSILTQYFSFNGAFYAYTKNYFVALFHWLRGKDF